MNYLNIKIEEHLNESSPKSFEQVYQIKRKSKIKIWVSVIGIALLILLFLPWTQNITSKGKVTTLYQEQRPQELNSVLPGRVEKWFVKEGDYVKKGDTLIEIKEIKDDYLDPALLERTKEQINAKQTTANNYKNKVIAAQSQLNALLQAKNLKLKQIQNKIQQQRIKVESDKAELRAVQNEYDIAQKQYNRNKDLYDQGLISLTQFEQRSQSLQNSLSKRISVENKLTNSQQELTILELELSNIEQDYFEKSAKVQSDQFQSEAAIATTGAEIAKLQNQYSTYDQRRSLYVITAPQDGQIINAKVAGIGEIIKDGEHLLTIVPDKIAYAVELYVRPVDISLIKNNQEVRFLFDGIPAIVFSGWPRASYGTFSGKVVFIESNISSNGMYRILATPNKDDRPWPEQLRIGMGANGIALLKNVPIWYELWRNINGFPPDYYVNNKPTENAKK